MTDDRQPGVGGAGSTVDERYCVVCGEPPSNHTHVQRDAHLRIERDQLRAALEVAQDSNVILDTALQHCCEANQDLNARYEQSRATEAELRAQITELTAQNERFDKRYRDAEAVVEAAQRYGAMVKRTHGVNMPWAEVDAFLAALDAAESPTARGETSQDAAKRAV